MSGAVLSRDSCDHIIRRTKAFAQGGGRTFVRITSYWSADLHWSHNDTDVAADVTDQTVAVMRFLPNGARATVYTNQTDDLSLTNAVRAAERLASMDRGADEPMASYPLPPLPLPETTIWSSATAAATPGSRVEIARQINAAARAKGMLASGYSSAVVYAVASDRSDPNNADPESLLPKEAALDSPGLEYYAALSHAECTVTVRQPQNRGSGWAGMSSYDIGHIKPEALAKRALEKCEMSLDPVAIEPGRYTVVLEPQAVGDLLERAMLELNADRRSIESPGPNANKLSFFSGPFDKMLGLRRSKLGARVVDERITIHHDPTDTELGVFPRPGLAPITWIDRGVLTTLPYERESYAVEKLHQNLPMLMRPAARLDFHGPLASLEEMIATTKRGLLVTRFWGVEGVGFDSMCRGMTRDGLWLIEAGKIVKPVQNMWFTDSLLFALNRIEQAGTSVKIHGEAVVPPMKIREFSFTALSGAV